MMGNNEFFVKVGDEYLPVHSIGSDDMDIDEKPSDDAYVLSDMSSWEFQCEMQCDVDIAKAVMPRSMYNSYALKRDGYLSPKNASFKPEADDEDYTFSMRR